jgi:hypothetical protein
MTPDVFRRLALARPNAVESTHLGVIDFGSGGRFSRLSAAQAGAPW